MGDVHDEAAYRQRVREHLMEGFLIAEFPGRSERARRWLTRLSAPRTGSVARPDVLWWDLGALSLPQVWRQRCRFVIAPATIFVWTALSAGLLNGFVFNSLRFGLADALRIAAATVLCYAFMTFLTGNFRAAIMAAFGAYIAGVISGAYDLAIAAGLAGGFAWRQPGSRLVLRRDGAAYPLIFGAAVVATAGLIRAVGALDLLSLPKNLTEGFVAGFADGLVSGWDQDVNGFVASGTVAALLTAVGMRLTPRHADVRTLTVPFVARLGAVRAGLLSGCLVTALNSWADGFRENVEYGWQLAPADGVAVGLAVWAVITVTRASAPGGTDGVAPSGRRALLSATAVGLVATFCAIVAYNGKSDVHDGWARGLADGIAAGYIVWLVLAFTTGLRSTAPVEDQDLSLKDRLRIGGPAILAGCALIPLFAMSAGWAVGAVFGIAFGVLVLYRSGRSPQAVTEALIGVTVPAVEAGVCTLVVVGLIAGLPYGLIAGSIVALATKIATEVAERAWPSIGFRISPVGIVGGSILGATVAAGAAFRHIDGRWLPLIWASATLATLAAFGTTGRPATQEQVMSARRLLSLDRLTFLWSVLGTAIAVSVAVGTRTTAGGNDSVIALAAALSTFATYGLTAGLTVAAARSRYGIYTLERTLLAVRGELPWTLMAFLEEANKARALGRFGPAYRFRYPLLAQHLHPPRPDPSHPTGRTPTTPPPQ